MDEETKKFVASCEARVRKAIDIRTEQGDLQGRTYQEVTTILIKVGFEAMITATVEELEEVDLDPK